MNFIDKYQQVRIIKSGAFGTLFEVKEISNDEKYYALKMMKKDLSKEYEKEVEVMKNIKSE